MKLQQIINKLILILNFLLMTKNENEMNNDNLKILVWFMIILKLNFGLDRYYSEQDKMRNLYNFLWLYLAI